MYDNAENDGRDQHLDKLDEAIAERFHLRGEIRHEEAGGNTQNEGNADLSEQGFRPIGHVYSSL
jgi:hypothetical protein